jgi:hypothetical protein
MTEKDVSEESDTSLVSRRICQTHVSEESEECEESETSEESDTSEKSECETAPRVM